MTITATIADVTNQLQDANAEISRLTAELSASDARCHDLETRVTYLTE
jgi:hypothetical protein